ncbi:hypothetical protein CK203_065044 [Vitis vinifera]|uniref:Reverse transcriptase RNase H-like domain-containing protein n=1 Tax=Vitis vinifera TaxID=29760 RepID=A0A438G739_VITVI|nr:hypothetical protein CK203_065044 [Vitis vinifera]
MLLIALVWATQRLRHYMTEYSVHLISRLNPLRYLFDRLALVGRLMRWLVLLTEFDIHYVTQKSIKWSIVVGVLLISPRGDHIPRSVRLAFSDQHPTTNNIGEWKTRDVKLRPYHAYLELLVRRFDDLRYTHLSRAQNQFVDALDTLASMIDILVAATVCPLLIELRSAPTYCCLIDEVEFDDGLPWYHGIYQLLRLDHASTDRVMREVHAGVCGPHMGGYMLAHKIMRTGYFWLTMKTDYLWGIAIIGRISPKSSSGHDFILVAINYFTKWVKVASYARLTSFGVARATPYSLVYGMEAVLPIEIEMGSFRVALEQQIPKADWAQARLDQLNLLNKRRLWAIDHVRAYQMKMGCAFKKRVKPRLL